MTDQIAIDSPAIGETSGQTESTKTENKDSSWHGIPETIRHRLSCAPVLPHESEGYFLELFESFRNYAKPEDIIDYHLVYMATACKWEADRYRSMAVAVTSNQQQAGLASLFEQTNEIGLGEIGHLIARTTARQNAMRCFTDDAYREESYFKLRKARIHTGRPSIFVGTSSPRHDRASACFRREALRRDHERA
jgi:hypothetical protein